MLAWENIFLLNEFSCRRTLLMLMLVLVLVLALTVVANEKR